MIPIAIALVVVQEMAARMGAVTGKGLSDLIREEFGFRLTFFVMLALVVTNFGNVVAEFAGVASSLELFGASRYIVVPAAAFIVWVIVVRGTYDSIEKIFLTASAFYVCYIVAGLLAQPDWKAAAYGTVTRPTAAGIRTYGYVYMVVGLVGTTIAPWMQFYLQASIVEKGVTVRQYRASRWDVILGCIFSVVVAWFIIVACAATLYTSWSAQHHECRGRGAGAAAACRRIRVPPVRRRTVQRVALYCVDPSDLDGVRGLRRAGIRVRSRQEVPRGAGVLLALYAAHRRRRRRAARSPGCRSSTSSVLSQVANGVLLPFILIFMLLLTNDRELMGDHVELARVQHRRLDHRRRHDRAVARDVASSGRRCRSTTAGRFSAGPCTTGPTPVFRRTVITVMSGPYLTALARRGRRRERRHLRAGTAPRDGQVVLSVLHRALGLPAGLPPAGPRRHRRLHEPEEAADGVLLLRRQRGHVPAVLRHRQPLSGRRPASCRRQPVLWRIAGALQRVPQRHRDRRSPGQGVEPGLRARLSWRRRAAARKSRPAAECGDARHRRWTGGAALVPVGRTLVGRLLDRHVPAAAIPGGGDRAAGRRFRALRGLRGAGRVVPRPPPSAATRCAILRRTCCSTTASRPSSPWPRCFSRRSSLSPAAFPKTSRS